MAESNENGSLLCCTKNNWTAAAAQKQAAEKVCKSSNGCTAAMRELLPAKYRKSSALKILPW